MKIEILWVDDRIQKWKILENNYSTIEYYIRDGCIDFYGSKISSRPLPLVQSEEKKDYVIPLNSVRVIEIDKDA